MNEERKKLETWPCWIQQAHMEYVLFAMRYAGGWEYNGECTSANKKCTIYYFRASDKLANILHNESV